MERSGVLPTTKFAYRKGLHTCNARFTLQSAMESLQETLIV